MIANVFIFIVWFWLRAIRFLRARAHARARPRSITITSTSTSRIESRKVHELLAGNWDESYFFCGIGDAKRGAGLGVFPLHRLALAGTHATHRLILAFGEMQAFVFRVVNDLRHCRRHETIHRFSRGSYRRGRQQRQPSRFRWPVDVYSRQNQKRRRRRQAQPERKPVWPKFSL